MIRLIFIGRDFWDRELYEDESTKKQYCSVDGTIHTMTPEGEPWGPLTKEHTIMPKEINDMDFQNFEVIDVKPNDSIDEVTKEMITRLLITLQDRDLSEEYKLQARAELNQILLLQHLNNKPPTVIVKERNDENEHE